MEELQTIDLESALLANGAHHYQYFGKNDCPIPSLDAPLALEMELFKNAPLEFEVRHVYADINS